MQTEGRDLEHREIGPGARRRYVDLDRDVGELVDRAGRPVVVDDHGVVEGAGLGCSAPDVIAAGRAELGAREQRGHAVEIASIEPERILVDQRGDRVDVAPTGTAHRRTGIREYPRTLPECTRSSARSSIS